VKLYNDLTLKFERPQWSRNSAFALIDTILEQNPELIELLSKDILQGNSSSQFGRQDTPSVEQIVRATIFKEMKNLDYRELEFAQNDSRICATFIKLDERKPYSFQMFQKYISRISEESLQQLLYEINKIAISEGLEDLKSLRQDSTVVKSNIHYPTNNALVWDCIKESHRLLEHLQEECGDVSFRDISDRLNAEQELKKEKNLLRMLMENTPDHIYFKDTESRFVRLSNSQAEGYNLDSPTEALGKTDFDFFSEKHANLAFKAEQEIMRTKIGRLWGSKRTRPGMIDPILGYRLLRKIIPKLLKIIL